MSAGFGHNCRTRQSASLVPYGWWRKIWSSGARWRTSLATPPGVGVPVMIHLQAQQQNT